MAEYSSHYRLIELDEGEKLSTDDFAFTKRNIENIDQKLYLGAEAHHHNGDDPAAIDPDSPLSAVLVTGSGNIPGGRTVRYKYAWVDQYGQETAASPETVISTPSQVAVPGRPTSSHTATGGSLLPGNYFYVLTAWVDSNTLETTAGDRTYLTLFSGNTNKVTLTFPSLPSGADGFNIYRRSPGSQRFQWLDYVDIGATPATTYIDDGSTIEDCNRTLPNRNTTAGSNSIDLTLPGATPSVPDGYTWKIYRTYTINDYDSSLLHWVVEETSEGSGIITTDYTDVGASTSAGRPLAFSQLIGSPSKILLTDGEEAEGYLPPGLITFPIVVNFSFADDPLVVRDGDWTWINNYEFAQITEARLNLGVDSVPAATEVIVDILKYTALTDTWSTIFTGATIVYPTVPVGQMVGDVVTLNPSSDVSLVAGDGLRADVVQIGSGATPTDKNLVVSIKLVVRDGDTDTSFVFLG